MQAINNNIGRKRRLQLESKHWPLIDAHLIFEVARYDTSCNLVISDFPSEKIKANKIFLLHGPSYQYYTIM